MATREKTIIYAFPTFVSDSTNNVAFNLSQITIHIPEASPTFTSVYAEVGWQDIITLTGGSIANHNFELRLGGAAYTANNNATTISNTGENQSAVFGPIDYTSHFTTFWTGTSMTCDFRLLFNQTTGTTLGMRNVTAVLYITYTYNDDVGVNANQIKTAIIPLESLVGALATAANSNIGTNQIPILTGAGGTLPENTVTIRDYFFVIEGNESNNNTTTNFTLTANIDSGGSPFAFGVQVANLASDRFCRWIYKPTVPTTTAVHQFQLWSSVADKAHSLCINLYVTYQFNAASTTRVLNTLLLPISMPGMASTNAALPSSWGRKFNIQEGPPGGITFRQSAYRIGFITTGSVSGLNSRCGSQAYRAYTHIGTTMCGMNCFQQRIDSSAAQGAGITVARGDRDIKVDIYTSDATDRLLSITGLAIINYESDIGSDGPGQNSHFVFKTVLTHDAAAFLVREALSYSFPIPETNYNIISCGYTYYMYQSFARSTTNFNVERLSAEGIGIGYNDIYSSHYISDGEQSSSNSYIDEIDIFKKYPQDPNTSRLDIETERTYQLQESASARRGLVNFLCYHSFTYSISGTLSNYTGDGSGITVDAFRSDNDQLIGTATTAAGGSYTITWYDNTVTVYTVARQSSVLLGRSDNDFAA